MAALIEQFAREHDGAQEADIAATVFAHMFWSPQAAAVRPVFLKLLHDRTAGQRSFTVHLSSVDQEPYLKGTWHSDWLTSNEFPRLAVAFSLDEVATPGPRAFIGIFDAQTLELRFFHTGLPQLDFRVFCED
jgi:hypothetical protein